MHPVDFGIIMNFNAVINRVYVLPDPAAYQLCARYCTSTVSGVVGLYLKVVDLLTVSSSLEPYWFPIVSTHARELISAWLGIALDFTLGFHRLK